MLVKEKSKQISRIPIAEVAKLISLHHVK